MDISAIAGVVRPGDTLIIGMHPDSDPDMDFTALREALPTTPIVVILGAESMAIHRGDNNKGGSNTGDGAQVPEDQRCHTCGLAIHTCVSTESARIYGDAT